MLLHISCLLLLLHAGLPAVQTTGVTMVTGDVYIQMFASMYRKVGGDGYCSDVDHESVKAVEAVRWTLESFNSQSPLKIGLNVVQTCFSSERTEELTVDLVVEMWKNMTNPPTVGVIGGESSSESDAISRLLSSLPKQFRLPMISFSATAVSLRNKDLYRNFFRVIPPDDIQVTTMFEVLMKFNWTYVAVIYDNNAYGLGVLQGLLNMATTSDICISARIGVQPGQTGGLGEKIRDDIINASVPISGILVFGGLTLAEAVINATENIVRDEPNVVRPTFLFSEASGSIEKSNSSILKGAFILSPTRRTVEDFETHFATRVFNLQTDTDYSSRKWLRDYYHQQFGCDLVVGHACAVKTQEEIALGIVPSLYNQYAIQAALAMVKAIKNVHSELCPSSLGACDALLTTPRNVFAETFSNLRVYYDIDFGTFRIPEFRQPDLIITFNGSTEIQFDGSDATYEVYNIQNCPGGSVCSRKIAMLSENGNLMVSTNEIRDYDSLGNQLIWPNIRKAQCPDGHICSECVTSQDATLFIEGDLYIVGVVPVHNSGDTPLRCGGIKTGGLDVVEAIRFAINEAQTTYAPLVPSGRIGLVLIDSCNDAQVIQEKILTLHRRGALVNGVYQAISDKIIGYIGGWSSDTSKALAAVTTRLGFPQISYASTASVLSRRDTYPFFMRVPSTDEQQVETMMHIIETFNSDLIQIVYSPTAYGEGGRDSIIKYANENDICIANVFPMSRETTSDQLVNSLRQYKDAKLVLFFVGSFEIDGKLESINDALMPDEFLFISSDGIGTRNNMEGLTNLKGMITLTVELPINEKFKDHMKNLSPEYEDSNPWIRPYMESYFSCYYERSFNKTSGQKCRNNKRLNTLEGYVIENWAAFAERATISLLIGAKTVLDQYCASETVCDDLRSNTDEFVRIISNVRLQINNRLARVYDDNGDGEAGFQIYAVSLDTNGQYEKVGSGPPYSFLVSAYRGIKPTFLNSTCGSQEYCRTCRPALPLKTVSENLSTGIIVLIVALGFVCCVLVGILLFVCNRHGCCLKIENGKPKFINDYITPVYRNGIRNPPEVRYIPDESYDTISSFPGESGTGTATSPYPPSACLSSGNSTGTSRGGITSNNSTPIERSNSHQYTNGSFESDEAVQHIPEDRVRHLVSEDPATRPVSSTSGGSGYIKPSQDGHSF